MADPNEEFADFLSSKADVVIPALEREGALSATEVLATHSWFKRRMSQLKSSGGRPTNPEWTIKRQIPFAPAIWEQLKHLAGTCAHESGVRIGPGQLAAFLLEDAVVAVVSGDGKLRMFRKQTQLSVTEIPQPQDPRAREWEPDELFFGLVA